jgi:uroporphyrinogen decarboxylase
MSNILKDKPIQLDLTAAIANIKGTGTPKRVFSFEHGIEPGIKKALCKKFNLCEGLDLTDEFFLPKRQIRIQQFLGQEFMRVFPKGIFWQGLPTGPTGVPPSVGPIQSWEDFEHYPWPRVEHIDFSNVQWYEKNLPDNIAMWSMTYLFQKVSDLIGFAPMCMKLYEERDLVKAVTGKVGSYFVKFTEIMSQFSRCSAISIGDDMGHKSATLISPDDIREIFIPWHKKIISTAHAGGKLGFFHVCGQVEAVMNDLIDDVGIDAKHSTQDVIEPYSVSKKRWGSRVALLGGVDVDFITRSTTDEVKEYTYNLLDACVPGGGFAIGVGNWVADTIPFENYLALLEAARSWRSNNCSVPAGLC